MGHLLVGYPIFVSHWLTACACRNLSRIRNSVAATAFPRSESARAWVMPGRPRPSSVDSLSMRRTAILIAMLLAMLWQSTAMARVGSAVNPLSDLAHATLHWNGEGHHHHDDGSYRLDDSKESVHHMAADHLNASLASVAPSSHDFPALASAPPNDLHAARVSNPALDGLLRPPRSRT